MNALNQYTNRDVPGYVDIKSVSFATNTVTVSGQTAYRKVEYCRAELPVNNSSAALWTNIIVAATGQTSVTGNLFVAKSPETFGYDADGNMTNDGRWALTWDAENRLIEMGVNTGVGPQRYLRFEYDWQGRRIGKKVWYNSNGNGQPDVTLKFVYDGWNLVAVLNGSSVLQQSFLWGLDLSGSEQGAGGVGGLLAVKDVANGSHFTAFDGNGNVTALVSVTNGAVTARYEYGPFGEVIRLTGAMGKANPFRFSTKYQDDETDLLYYGYRFYNQSLGKWLSRDPIAEPGFEVLRAANTVPRVAQVVSTVVLPPNQHLTRDSFAEKKGPNLYAFVDNQPISKFDPLGLDRHRHLIYRCQIEILAGHGYRIPQPLLIDPCSAASIVSCEAAGLSNPRPIPGIDPRPVEDINLIETDSLAGKDFEAGKKYARKICEIKKCNCQEVTVTVKCDWMSWWERALMNNCGKTITVKCCH